MNHSRHACLLTLLLLAFGFNAHAADWVRHGVNTNQLVWGARGGLMFAIHPASFSGGDGGPRGLIRIGYPTLTSGGYDLINFIAVEPVVKGRKGFSELEPSQQDQRPGKQFWAGPEPAGVTTSGGREQTEVVVGIERFDNGAHVRLRLRQRSDAPDELRVIIETEPDSAAMDYCILTATMGNKARTRQVWLRDGLISSLTLYPDFAGQQFAPHHLFALNRLPRLAGGDVVVAVTTDEENPSAVQPFGRPHFWDYRGIKITQYWRKPVAAIADDLHCAVNARFTYYGTGRPIPGGVAFENFELRQRFRDGDEFVFGVTRRPPSEMFPRVPPKS